jgi:hypothetical protein
MTAKSILMFGSGIRRPVFLSVADVIDAEEVCEPRGRPAVLVPAPAAVVVAVAGQRVPPGQDPGNRRLARPPRAAESQSVAKRGDRVPARLKVR